MTKKETLVNPSSCLNTAQDDEELFVLKQKDEAMAATIRFWADKRMRMGLNIGSDAKIKEALALADKLDREIELRQCTEDGL